MSRDARLLELEFLSQLNRCESLNVSKDESIPRRDLIVHLLEEQLVNDIAGYRVNQHQITYEAANSVRSKVEYHRNLDTLRFLAGQEATLRISHKGRVRLAELEQAIKTGREREPFGILFNGRYWERDLRIALLSASPDAPVALCFLDMNGLKFINDTHGHGAGDEAIRAYLRVVAASVEEVGDAYRYGGDEVLVILPGRDAQSAAKIMAALLQQLAGEQVRGNSLTASCGIVVAVASDIDPQKLRDAVDAVQYKAKAESKAGATRRSVLAIEGHDLQVF